MKCAQLVSEGAKVTNFSRLYLSQNFSHILSSFTSKAAAKFQTMNSNKRKRRGKTLAKEEDRISSLPDDVLSHILALLPIKTSVSTSVLSSRWIDLYASVPDLTFDDSLDYRAPTNVTPFALCVSMVLFKVLKKLGHIRKFHLKCLGKYDYDIIATWISLATIRNLEKLHVTANLIESGPVPVPKAVLNCRTLVDFQLHGNFCLYVPHDVTFPCLKTLSLSNVVMVNDAGVKRFFAGCLVLENLSISDCVLETINVFEVSVPSLIWLYMSKINDLFEFRLNAPILEVFHCHINAGGGYSGTVLNSLVHTDISIELDDEQFEEVMIHGLINMVSGTKSLTLEEDSMKALVYSDYPLATFHNLTELRVYSRKIEGWNSLTDLLDNAPHLEVLSFHHGFIEDSGFFVEVTTFLPEWVPTCVSCHLKEVKFGSFQGEEDEIKMVEYFLKNAKVLEKVTISPSPAFDSDLGDILYLTMKEQLPVAKRILRLPRSSRACRIDFADGYQWDL